MAHLRIYPRIPHDPNEILPFDPSNYVIEVNGHSIDTLTRVELILEASHANQATITFTPTTVDVDAAALAALQAVVKKKELEPPTLEELALVKSHIVDLAKQGLDHLFTAQEILMRVREEKKFDVDEENRLG
jgi:hypothetical protein